MWLVHENMSDYNSLRTHEDRLIPFVDQLEANLKVSNVAVPKMATRGWV